MPNERAKFSINRHFRREAIVPSAIFGAIIVLAIVGAAVAPWLFEHLR